VSLDGSFNTHRARPGTRRCIDIVLSQRQNTRDQQDNIHPSSKEPAAPASEPINLYKLGMHLVTRWRYPLCRTGNDPQDLELTPDRIDARAIASFGTKDLLNPDRTCTVFHHIEEKARHVLQKHPRPFAAARRCSHRRRQLTG
jgi:hypothetical protein